MCHSREDRKMGNNYSDHYFPETKPTGWSQRNYPNANPRLKNRVWRKQCK